MKKKSSRLLPALLVLLILLPSAAYIYVKCFGVPETVFAPCDDASEDAAHTGEDALATYASTADTSTPDITAPVGSATAISAADTGKSAGGGDTASPVQGNKGELTMQHPDRTTYQDGFYYEPLNEEIKTRIYGLSYKTDCSVPYEELRYVKVRYLDFDGEEADGEIICNQAIAQDLVEIFYTLYQNRYPIEKVRLIDEYDADDDLSCADNNTSCFNYREIAGSKTLSNHALGMAIDINPFYNPYITYPDGKERISPEGSEAYADRASGLPHMILKGDPCYNLFIEHGFTWGGEWRSVKDYQHFEKELH